VTIAVSDIDAPIDLAAYFARIGLQGPIDATAKGLTRLHAAHAQAVPFETLDLHLGQAIRDDLPGLFDKLVTRRRGGYCFEQNGLFAAVLSRLGFTVTHVLARTLFGNPGTRPPAENAALTQIDRRMRGHLISLVEIAGERWIADVGFGAYGLIESLKLVSGEQQAGGETYLIAPTAGGFEVQMRSEGAWLSLYELDFRPCELAEVIALNQFHQTSMTSFFRRTRLVARTLSDRRLILTDDHFKILTKDGAGPVKQIPTDAYHTVLAERFGIRLPDSVRFLS